MIYIVGHLNRYKKFHKKIIKIGLFRYKYLDVNILEEEYKDDYMFSLHPSLCELIGQYYAYNYDLVENKKDGYIGFCHYRRPILPNLISKEELYNVVFNDDVITFCEANYINNIQLYKDKKRLLYKKGFNLLDKFDIFVGMPGINNYIYNDIYDYSVNIQKIIGINNLNVICNKNQNIYTKNMFLSNIKVFEQIYNFYFGFIKYYFDKYNIKDKESFWLRFDKIKETYLETEVDSEIHENRIKFYNNVLIRFFAYFGEYINGIILKNYNTIHKNLNNDTFISFNIINKFKIS